jgi:RNA polymerase sigma-70 factor (ECF subfamily)
LIVRRRDTVEVELTLGDARPVTFVELADPLLTDAYRLAGYLLGSAPDAEDAVQEALARAWKAWPTLRDRSRFEPWFDRILVNICRDRLRTKRGRTAQELDEDLPAYSDDPFRAALARAEIDRLVQVLSPDHRVVIGLRFWRDLSLQEIADLLGIPIGTVQSRLHYALRCLREAAESGLGEHRSSGRSAELSLMERKDRRAVAERHEQRERR